jgi:hypothetical protein
MSQQCLELGDLAGDTSPVSPAFGGPQYRDAFSDRYAQARTEGPRSKAATDERFRSSAAV